MFTLFDRIQQVKNLKNITIRSIEQGSGLPTGTIKKWKYSMPSGDKILNVANYLDVSVDYLLGNTDNPLSHRESTDVLSAISQLSQVLSSFEDAAHTANSKIQEIAGRFDVEAISPITEQKPSSEVEDDS